MRSLFTLFGALMLAFGCDRAPAQPTVFAASSMREFAAAWSSQREAGNESPRLQFAGSQVLRLQIERGAPADLFISANQDHVEALAQKGLVRRSMPLFHNHMVVIVSPESATRLESLVDLEHANSVVMGGENVPAGQYGRKLLECGAEAYGAKWLESVDRLVASRENNVRLVRAKVELGQADAGIVYATDVATVPFATLEVPSECQIRATYYGAALTEQGDRMLDSLVDDAAKRLARDHGLEPME